MRIHYKYKCAVIVGISKTFECLCSTKASLLQLGQPVCVKASTFCGRKSALLFHY